MLQKVNIPIFDWPKPCENNQGGIRGERNIIEPLWTKARILPRPVVDLLDSELNNELANNDQVADFEQSCDFKEDDEDIEN